MFTQVQKIIHKIVSRENVLLKMVIMLGLGNIFGVTLLTFAFCIPVDRMLAAYQTVGIESLEKKSERYIVDYESSFMDCSTEHLMMKVAATPLPPTGENIFQKALRCYTLNNEWNHGLTFTQYEWKGQTYSCDSYERYWHGYAILLKPLMFFFTYTDIVFLNIFLQMLLISIIIYLFRKKGMEYLQLPFLIFQVVSMQIIVGFSLDFSVCFYIYAIALLFLLCKPNICKQYPLFFMGIGMVTAYMDLLTWPLITLGIPLIVFLFMGKQGKDALKRAVISTLFWGIGYVGQWSGKWIIATLFLSDNVIKDAINQFGVRSSSVIDDGLVASWGDVIQRNLSVFNKNGYKILFVLIAIWLFWTFIKKVKSKTINFGIMAEKTIPYLAIAAYPFFWFFVTKEHSFTHASMTWRILSISVFAICSLINSPFLFEQC